MSKHSWLRDLFARPVAGPARRGRLAVEALEDRDVPATFTVTTLADSVANDGATSFREAITAANSAAGADTINFAPGLTGTINLAGALPAVSDVNVQGPGADHLTVRRNTGGDYSVFTTSGNVTLSGLTVANGVAGVARDGQRDGGGIYNYGTLALNDCQVSDNFAANHGGGIYNDGGSAAGPQVALTLTNCLVARNTAVLGGGGVYSVGTDDSHGALTLINSTLAYNAISAGYGGGVFSGGDALTTLRDCTVAYNTATATSTDSNDWQVGAGVCLGPGTSVRPWYAIANTLVVNNTANNPGGGGGRTDDAETLYFIDEFQYLLVPAVLDGSLISADVGGHLNLGPLQNNGGPTATFALPAGSPAINAGNNAYTLWYTTTDQRGSGFARVRGGTVDIGAYEYQSDNTAPTVAANAPAVTVNEGSRATNAGTFNDAQGRSTVTLTASIGTLTRNDAAGTWSWSYTPPDNSGSIPVTITATDNEGFSKSTTFTLTVNNVAPTITAFNVPTTGVEGSPVQLSATATDPGGAGDPLTYTWTVIRPDGTTLATLTGASPSFTPPDNGGYGVKLTVSDGDGGSATHSQVAPPGLVSWWRGEGGAADALGANNGSGLGVTYALGKVGQAFNLDGTGRVFVRNSPSVKLDRALTLEAWVNPSSLDLPNGRAVIIAKSIPGVSNYDLSVTSNGGVTLFYVGGGAYHTLTTAAGVVPVGQFTHIAATLDTTSGTGVVASVYVNGRLSKTMTFPYSPLQTSDLTNLTVGGYNYSNGFGFKGLIDEPAVYGRALSASQIQGIYNAGAAGKPLPIAVANAAPAPALAGPTSGRAGQSLAFTASALDPSPVDQAAGFGYSINWGDGSAVQSIARTPGDGSGGAFGHVYLAPGTYTVTLTATDKDGGARSVTRTVTISS